MKTDVIRCSQPCRASKRIGQPYGTTIFTDFARILVTTSFVHACTKIAKSKSDVPSIILFAIRHYYFLALENTIEKIEKRVR